MSENRHPEGHILQAYHDGELEASAAARVAEHCRSCESCRAELESLGELGRLLTATVAPEMSGSVWPRLRQSQTRQIPLKPVFAVAACAAGIVLGVLMGPLQFSDDSATTEVAWTENLNLWNTDSTSSLLGVYESGLE